MNTQKILATITEEELNQLFTIESRKKASVEMLDKIQKQIAVENINAEKWFMVMKEKYNLDDGEVHVNIESKTIREGRV